MLKLFLSHTQIFPQLIGSWQLGQPLNAYKSRSTHQAWCMGWARTLCVCTV